jgi:hypothetical protein
LIQEFPKNTSGAKARFHSIGILAGDESPAYRPNSFSTTFEVVSFHTNAE